MVETATLQDRRPAVGKRRRQMICAAAAMLACAQAGSVWAQSAANYPNKPIRLVVPYGVGGVSDSIGRVLAQGLSKALGQSVVVENRGGGGGTIGAAVVATAAPDGYTILLTSPPMVAIAPTLLPNLSYNAVEDFTPIGTALVTPNILTVNPSLPVKTLKDIAEYAKKHGAGSLSFASAGPGSTGHVSGHILQTAVGVEMVHIPYKSSALAFPDVIAGRVSMVFDSMPSSLGYIRSGQVKPIAVMSKDRSDALPDVPTAAESGFPNATMRFWMGLEGPKGMDPAVVQRLNDAMQTAVRSDEMRKQMQTLGAEAFVTSAAEFDKLRREDIVELRKLMKEMGLAPQ